VRYECNMCGGVIISVYQTKQEGTGGAELVVGHCTNCGGVLKEYTTSDTTTIYKIRSEKAGEN